MLNIFTDNWSELPELYDGERLVKIITSNKSDELYAVIDDTTDDPDEELALALRANKGSGAEYRGYEDVSWMCESTDE